MYRDFYKVSTIRHTVCSRNCTIQDTVASLCAPEDPEEGENRWSGYIKIMSLLNNTTVADTQSPLIIQIASGGRNFCGIKATLDSNS